MNFKKFFVLILFIFLAYESINVQSPYVLGTTASPYVTLEKAVIRKANDFRRSYYQRQILNECQFIHRENFVNLDPDIFELMINQCDKYDLPYTIFFSVVDKESGFRFIRNSEGSHAMGYMQMMPTTFNYCAKMIGLKGGHTPENNIRAGAYHLYDLHRDWSKKYPNDEEAWRWALAQYAAGLGGMQVKDSTGIHYEIPESTVAGIEKVMKNYSN